MSFRFLHSSDLHLGKPFGQMPEGLRGRLREARHQSIGRLAAAARNGGAGHILLAGDTFDAETPAPDTLRQALNTMAENDDLIWLLLPGNHDSLAATELWNRIAAQGPDNLRVLARPAPEPVLPGVTILPAPCTQRRPGRDLTDWMEDHRADGTIRIGIAHGPITDFGGGTGATGLIAPDRAERAGLDYLALGDWHGTLKVDHRTYYAGTPEHDRFKHGGVGKALLVGIAGAGAEPETATVETGSFHWDAQTLDLLPGDDPEARLAGVLPQGQKRRNTLVQLSITGRASLPEQAALSRAFAAIEPDFGLMIADKTGLGTEAKLDDLDLIDHAGALRAAAETLLAEHLDAGLDKDARDVAAAALARLYDYATDEIS